jgi:gamma-glutamylcyclotransferase (GGCT)/AIG2-like uncharacterized protein YtfP
MGPHSGNQGIGADGLFVYGSLRTGGSRHSWLRRTNPEGFCLAWAPGRLFHLPEGGYPAMVPTPEPEAPPPGPGWVAGEFAGYENEDDLQRATEDLDSVEGVEEGLFERRAVGVVLDSGHPFVAWAYVFPEERLGVLERRAVELPGGDWSAYLV